MFPGPFSIVSITTNEDSDDLTYDDLAHGYDTYEQARADLTEVATSNGLSMEQVGIIRVWFRHDLEDGEA